jgi:hypothetical protein
VGLLVGAAVTVSVNAAVEVGDLIWTRELFLGFWGLLYGSLSAVIAFGLALAFTSRSSRSGKVGWVIAALTSAIFGGLVVTFVVAWRLSPWTLEGAWIYPLAVLPLAGSVYCVGRALGRFGPIEDSRPASILKRSERVTAGVFVGFGIAGTLFLREPLRTLFARGYMRGVELNLVGLTSVAAWSAIVIIALVAVLRARHADPTFRGGYSELLQILALLQTCLVIATWGVITASGVYF